LWDSRCGLGMTLGAALFRGCFGGVHLLVTRHARVLNTRFGSAVVGADVLVAVRTWARFDDVGAMRLVTSGTIREPVRLEPLFRPSSETMAFGALPGIGLGGHWCARIRRASLGSLSVAS